MSTIVRPPTELGDLSRYPQHFLRLSNLDPALVAELVELSRRMKLERHEWRDSLRGYTVGCIFEKPSTRTRVSLATAASRLGMAAIVLNKNELQFGHGETLGDTGRVISSYLDVITLRTFDHAIIEELSRASSVPVINALSNSHHPIQTLADLLALIEHFGQLNGLSVAFIGDGRSNTCNSFLEASAAFGMHLTVASPPGYEMDQVMVESAKLAMEKSGGSVTQISDPHAAVRGVHAIYAEVWVPMDKHHESAERVREFGRYCVDSALLANAPRDAMVLHCLPACRGEEITSEVLDGPRSLVWNQAANRLPTAQAVLYTFTARGFC